MDPAPRIGCLSDNTIAEFVEANLRAERIPQLEAHLATCAACRRVIVALASTVRNVSVAADETHVSTRGGERGGAARDIALDNYALRREIARGGMGRIFEAWDRRHHRRVAVKVLLLEGASATRRFAREARITARLQHPSIISLYEAGTSASGEAFFAMPLVAGRALGDVVAGTRSLRERLALLPHLAAVAEALAYAHGQGIVHRDLKPSNVLIGAFGEAVVIDWGLAKELEGSAKDDDDDPVAIDAGAGDAALTVAGQALGTPGYMPPEQASGAAIGPRADVYALGALLYHVLSGAPPYTGSSAKEVIALVRSEPPKPLGERVPELAPDLVAIVTRAMERDPAARYETAAELALDLRRLEAGQRVSAHSYSFATLLGRWIAKHRAAVVTAAVLVVALVVGGAVSVRRIVRERDRADAAKRTALVQRDAAEQLVAYVVGELKSRLDPLGKLALLSGLGAKVDAYYEATSGAAEGVDAGALDRRATALETLSAVEERKHDTDQAVALSRAAIAFRERALAMAPDDRQVKYELASNLVNVGKIERQRAHFVKDVYERARALGEELVARDPKNARWLAVLGNAHQWLGLYADDTGDRTAARDEYVRARDLYARAVDADPADDDALQSLSSAHFGLAQSADKLGDTRMAAESFDACVAIAARLLARDASNRIWQRRAAWCHVQRGVFEAAQGDLDRALADVRESKSLRDALRKNDPENVEWQREYSNSTQEMCDLLREKKRFDEAEGECATTLAIDEEVLARNPGNADAPQDVALDLRSAALVDVDRGRPERAIALYRRAIAMGDEERRKHPEMESWRSVLPALHLAAGDAELALGHREAARDHYVVARDSLAEARRAYPDDPELVSLTASTEALGEKIARAPR